MEGFWRRDELRQRHPLTERSVAPRGSKVVTATPLQGHIARWEDLQPHDPLRGAPSSRK